MEKPPYELGPLRAAVTQCNINIAAMQKAIDKEEKRKTEMLKWIRKHVAYTKWLKENKDVKV